MRDFPRSRTETSVFGYQRNGNFLWQFSSLAYFTIYLTIYFISYGATYGTAYENLTVYITVHLTEIANERGLSSLRYT